jgi:hypothetical protein
MPQILRKKIIANELSQAFSNTQVEVIWTATMQNGSLLVADGTEAAAAAIATAVYIINDYSVGDNGLSEPGVGDTVQVNCVTFGVKAYADQLSFSDRALTISDAAGVTGLIAKQIELV